MRARQGSIQKTFLPIRRMARDGIACYAGNQPDSYLYRSAIEVTGVNFGLLSEEEQRDVFEGYQRHLASVSFPTQLLVRVSRLDLNSYLQFLACAKAAPEEETWVKFARDHTRFVDEMTQDKMLLERRFYVLVPADDIMLEQSYLPRFRKKREQLETQTLEQAEQQLALRCELVSSALEMLGLHTHRLTADEYVRLVDDCLGTQRTVQYPLLEEAVGRALIGHSKLEDVLAPASIRVEADHIVVEEQEYLSALAIRSLPRKVSPGFFQQIVMMDNTPMDLIFTQVPKRQGDALPVLRRKQAQYESSRLYIQSKGRVPRPDINLASEDIGPLIDRVASGEEQLHNYAMHILVRATARDELQKRVRRVRETLHAIGLHRPQVMLFEQAKGFRQCLPGNIDAASDMLELDSSTVASAFPFFSNLVYRPSETALLEGITAQQEPVVSDHWELTNANQFFVAPSGKGKSFKKKIDITRLYTMYKAKAYREGVSGLSFQIFVLDPEREYHRLCEELGGQWVRFSAGSNHHINPFDLPQVNNQRQEAGNYEKEDVLTNQIQKLHLLLDMMLAHKSPDSPNATLSEEEKSLLDIALYEVYRRVGITSSYETHNRQAPLLRDLYHVLETGDVGEDTTGLARRLRRFVNGSLSGLFAGPTNVVLDNPLVVFDLKELDDELRPLALLMISDQVWNRAFASLIPRFLIIDELATLYRYRSGARFAEDMFARARKQYLSITGITQHPGLFEESAIMANCSTHVLLGQNHTTIDQVAKMFKLSPREAQLLRSFKRGQALMLVDGKRMQVSFEASEMEYKLANTDPRELAAWERERQANTSIGSHREANTEDLIPALAEAGQQNGHHSLGA